VPHLSLWQQDKRVGKTARCTAAVAAGVSRYIRWTKTPTKSVLSCRATGYTYAGSAQNRAVRPTEPRNPPPRSNPRVFCPVRLASSWPHGGAVRQAIRRSPHWSARQLRGTGGTRHGAGPITGRLDRNRRRRTVPGTHRRRGVRLRRESVPKLAHCHCGLRQHSSNPSGAQSSPSVSRAAAGRKSRGLWHCARRSKVSVRRRTKGTHWRQRSRILGGAKVKLRKLTIAAAAVAVTGVIGLTGALGAAMATDNWCAGTVTDDWAAGMASADWGAGMPTDDWWDPWDPWDPWIPFPPGRFPFPPPGHGGPVPGHWPGHGRGHW
jgi:hypothetical protein